jgi:hypothetical protein
MTWDDGVSGKAEEYRREAEKAEKMAEASRDQSVREQYGDIAKKWRELAAQAEKQGW